MNFFCIFSAGHFGRIIKFDWNSFRVTFEPQVIMKWQKGFSWLGASNSFEFDKKIKEIKGSRHSRLWNSMSSLSVVTARRVGDLYNIKRIVTTTPLSMLLKSAQGGVGDRFSIFYRRSNELKCRQTQTNFDATPLQSPLPLYAPVYLSCVYRFYINTNKRKHTRRRRRRRRERNAKETGTHRGQKRRALGSQKGPWEKSCAITHTSQREKD